MTAMSLTEAERVIQNAAKVYEALTRVQEIVGQAAALEQRIIERQRVLSDVDASIAKANQEALDLAAKAVKEEAAFRQSQREYETATAEARHTLARVQDEHAATLKRQQAESAEALGQMRQEHAAQAESYQNAIATLQREHADLAAALLTLKERFA